MRENEVPDIEFCEVTKKFIHSSEPTLNNFNLKVYPKHIHVIVGYSGAGKSVALKHILGLLKPDRGDVKIFGKSLNTLSEYELQQVRRNFGMLFQGAALFDSLNVFENVAFPIREHEKSLNEKAIKEKVRKLLSAVDLGEIFEKMPSELSGGMQKRVGLARAIALQPRILLFDEPTTGLDPVTTQIIDSLIERTIRNLDASALVISHDIRAALRMGDVVSMIWQGKIIETGSPQVLLKSSHEIVQNFLKSAGVN